MLNVGCAKTFETVVPKFCTNIINNVEKLGGGPEMADHLMNSIDYM